MPAVLYGFEDVHGVGTSQVVYVKQVSLLLQPVEGKVPVSIFTLWPVIQLKPSFSSKHRPLAFLHPETRRKPFPQSIDEGRVDLSADLKVVFAVDEVFVVGGK